VAQLEGGVKHEHGRVSSGARRRAREAGRPIFPPDRSSDGKRFPLTLLIYILRALPSLLTVWLSPMHLVHCTPGFMTNRAENTLQIC
jgi:hypothetical protein